MANTPLSKALRGRPARYLVAALAASLLALGVAAPPPTATPLRQAQTTPALRGAVASPAAQPLDLTPASLVELQNFTPDEARIWNAAIPASSAPNPAARPFVLSAGALSRARASDCLTAAVYYEATNESLEGLRAVAQVVLNRLAHPAFPKTVCGVVFQGAERVTGCQFTFTCDGALARRPTPTGWTRARAVADAALDGFVERRVGLATHYHADYVAPYWSGELTKVATIGAHIFYRWSGRGGLPPAFSGTYAAGEGDGAASRMRPELVSTIEVAVEAPPQETAAPAAAEASVEAVAVAPAELVAAAAPQSAAVAAAQAVEAATAPPHDSSVGALTMQASVF